MGEGVKIRVKAQAQSDHCEGDKLLSVQIQLLSALAEHCHNVSRISQGTSTNLPGK